MTLKEKIKDDLMQAVKGQEELRSSVLRLLSAVIANKETEKRTKIWKQNPQTPQANLEKESMLTDEEIMDIIATEIKKRKESIELFLKGGRAEMAEKEKKESVILQGYLPEQMKEEEIRKIVKDAMQKTGAKGIKEMGKVMSVITLQIKGKADMGQVSQIVKEVLS